MRVRLFFTAAALIFGPHLYGQVKLAGRVVSDTNTPLGAVALTIRPADGFGERLRTLTDPAGGFRFQLERPGEYLVDAELSGYFALKDRRIRLEAGDNDLRVTLNPVREFAESVDVAGGSTAVELDRTNSEEKLTGAQLLDVPFPTTNNLKNAMRILPNVVQDSRGGVHLNGGGEDQVRYAINGFDVSDPLTGRFDTRISIEAVQSMEALSGRFPAEYGKGSAGVVAISTKVGDDRVRYSATNFIPGMENQKGWHIGSWNPRFNLSGPIRKGRIWLSDSLALQYDRTIIRELPPGEDQSISWRYTNFLHAQANLSPSNILSSGFLSTAWSAARTGLSALDPSETTVDRRSRQWFAYLKDQLYFGRGALIEFGYASNRTFTRQIPQGHELLVLTPEGKSGNFFVDGTQSASRNQFLVNSFLPSFTLAGPHQLKAGLEADLLDYQQDMRRTGFEWRRTDQTVVRRVLYEGSGRLGRSNFEASAYVQDSWRLRRNVLLELGLRTDLDQILRNWNLSPRLGVAWSPRGMEDTKVSGGYAITYDATNLLMFTRPDDQYKVTTYFPPYGRIDEPIRSVFLIPGRHFSTPRYHNWSAAVDRRIGWNIYARVQAMARRGSSGFSYAFSQLQAGEAVHMLGNGRTDAYDSVEFTFRQNFRREYGWLASYTRSRAWSNAVVDLSADEPVIAGANAGRMPWDTPHRLLSWGYLPAKLKNWAVSYLMEYRTGFPFSVYDDVGNTVGSVNSWRYPDFFELNLHLEKRFHFRGQRWAGRVGFNNITDHRNPNTVNNNMDSDQFLRFYGGQSRSLNFRIRWLGKL